MVCDKIVIVNVDAALKNNGEILRLIKEKYPSISQLFNFRKSHQIHFVGTAQNDIYLAMNEVYAVVGEPFNFSEDDKTLFLKLVEKMTPNEMEAFLRDQFKPGECFARDDKLRHGWRMSGPMYGVCAPTAERRKELLHLCVLAINKQYNIHLELSAAGFSIDDHVPKSTNGELTAPHALSVQSPPTVADGSSNNIQAVSDKLGTPSKVEKRCDLSPPVAPTEGNSIAREGTSELIVRLENECAQSDGSKAHEDLSGMLGEGIELPCRAFSLAVLRESANDDVVSPTLCGRIQRSHESLLTQVAAPVPEELASKIVAYYTERPYRLVDVLNGSQEVITALCSSIGVAVSYGDDGHAVLYSQAAIDASELQQLLDHAEDIIFSQYGSGRLTVQVALMTSTIEKLFTPKPEDNTTQEESLVVQKSPDAVIQQPVEARCVVVNLLTCY